mgnify:CR=1 FL=1
MQRPFKFKRGDIVECFSVNINGRRSRSFYYLIIKRVATKKRSQRYYEFIDVGMKFASEYEDAVNIDNIEYLSPGKTICFRKVGESNV